MKTWFAIVRLVTMPAVLAAAFAGGLSPASAQTAGGLQISWEVRNRFRLFQEERDFTIHAEAMRGRTILASEQTLAVRSDGRGWARNTLPRLCIDQTGKISEPCNRDGVKESYLTPAEHAITVRLAGTVPVGAVCSWTFDDGDGARQSSVDCNEPLNLRVRYGKPTVATADVTSTEGAQRVSQEIEVRDVFIAGLGDSIASGEGNPDRPVTLTDEGFCFRSYFGGPSGQYFRPSRAGFTGGRACESTGPEAINAWQRRSAQWSNQACHRSLYSYQARAALALAVQNPHIAVTFLPLACTGATVTEGLLGSQRARECLVTRNAVNCEGNVNAQVSELREALGAVRRRQPNRQLDLVLLSIGANDINFSGLVADVIVDGGTERTLLRRSGVIGSIDESRSALARELPQRFAKLREALKPLVGEMSKVIFTSYANPTLANGAPCGGGRGGFDVHPSFNADPRRLEAVADYVQNEFLPQLRNIATCGGGTLCRDPSRDRMTFVDTHQTEFASHGFCARSNSDPEFDRACFSAKGDSFNPDVVAAANSPMTCGRGASEFRAYAPRARWIRDANDSYFAAMTYPQGVSSAQPTDIHDATWGIISAVYGGAIHPTAEGHAAMADAALPAITDILQLGGAEGDVARQPLPEPSPQTR